MAKKIPDVLTLDEQEKLLNQFNLRYITSQRNKTMIQLLLNTGLRLSEMTNLKWNDIDLMTGQVKVVEGKGLKDRILWLDEETLTMLGKWKQRQFKEWGRSDLVFTTRTLHSLDGKAVRSMIKTYSDKAGIKKHITTHSLRHTFASDLLRDTKNIRIVQKALGHADISSTQIYTHIVDEELEEALKSFRSGNK
ncbi:tyrosine-type recombinase/integrase [Vagococcus lutrae]|jgi:integrase/recombinase XerD|uniref:tyrosine-type recombinase/integrase n=1 Tax=Vagococcus lutrae TaxID=81947 RepID=UPI00288CCA4F|nr:tyrosine-type recombinase/integrase [Vagococcus lutrae]MDT2844957.1 tyrosine-type recombinase/integrase [Vagococcus lutrae]